jgi:hypothetical protein
MYFFSFKIIYMYQHIVVYFESLSTLIFKTAFMLFIYQ